MDGRQVDVLVISAEDLKKVNLLGSMHTYASVWIDPYVRQTTAVDREGGANPRWDQQLSFPVPEHFFQQPNARLTVEIYSKGTFSDDTFVGVASIPVSEIAQKTKKDAVSTYQVQRRSGKVQGSVRLLVKVGERAAIGAAAPSAPPAPYASDCKPYDDSGKVPYAYPAAAAAAAAASYGYPAPAPAPYAPASYGQQFYQQPPYYQAQQQPQYYQAQQQPQFYQAAPPPNRRPGGGGMGLGTGLLAGALGGFIVGDLVGDVFDGGCDGGGFGF